MWNPVHEVLLDRDNRHLLMRSPPPLFITAVSSAAALGKLGDEFVVTSGPGLETDACMTFPPCWYFMIKLKWSPEVHTGDFPFKTTNLFSERFLLCLWNHQYAGAYLQHQVKLALNHNSYQDYRYFCIMCMFFFCFQEKNYALIYELTGWIYINSNFFLLLWVSYFITILKHKECLMLNHNCDSSLY